MAHPGFAFAFVVGAGLAAILYYIFNDNNGHYGGAHNNNDSWDSSNRRSGAGRRNSGQSLVENDCTICLMELAGASITKISPCGHTFHKKCIQNWQLQSDMAGHSCCPNCRSKIRSGN
ncbi:hypothetical protein PV325_011608 [Microctonus aethiopoides]|uniref:RING-type domain-containing protein n=1 Tax=Microctonus aethiopoides TaxID=144406 RepID=A0AA39KKQ5_9HYME|nr:hypothetical protein PV325_011608 [Microctonus aethiopoides]KAK0095706.1 hypothetical protein PV326_007633 [Microctonus aethiopoides]KAK0164936.1 hypothetical protein PV328_003500 [Microctonus aethiopoides]